MDDVETLIRIGVLALIAVSGFVRVLAAFFFSGTRQSVKSHRVAHTCWFAGSAVALLLLLRLLFPARELIRLSSAANHPAALTAIASYAEEPIISLHLRDSFPTGSPPGVTLFAIDIFQDGRASVFPSQGSLPHRAISKQDLAGLNTFFKEQGVLGLTDAAIDAAIAREGRRSGQTNPYWAAGCHQPFTELKIRQGTNLTSLVRYSLPDQLRCQPNVKGLKALQRSLEKIYETVGARPR